MEVLLSIGRTGRLVVQLEDTEDLAVTVDNRDGQRGTHAKLCDHLLEGARVVARVVRDAWGAVGPRPAWKTLVARASHLESRPCPGAADLAGHHLLPLDDSGHSHGRP